MASSVIFEDQLEIPFLHSLGEFRAWAGSDRFPERGRIDYLAGRIEVDMSPEDIFSHGTLKTEIVRGLTQIVKATGIGYLLSDRTRVSSPTADLSAEPDVVFLSEQSLDDGLARLVPKTTGEPDRYVEVEGGPDLVVEIVSDRSVVKDTRRLPAAYYRAGVREFWLIDARGETLLFQIHRRGPDAFEAVELDANGSQFSAVLSTSFQLHRQRNDRGRWTFDLRTSS